MGNASAMMHRCAPRRTNVALDQYHRRRPAPRLIAAWIASDASVAEFARRFRVSRKTAHKFINRFKQLGDAGLDDLPRAPHATRVANADIAERIVEAKKANPLLGPKKTVRILRDGEPDLPWPAPSTAGAILDREGLVKRRKRSRRSPPFADPFADVHAPNDCWAIDFKGWARTSDGARLDPRALIDADSLFLIACEGLPRPTLACVLPVVERAFQERGLPAVIRSDNGPPFAASGLGGLSAFAVRLVKLGITPERIAPGHPEQNGRLERFHRTLKEASTSPPAATLADQQRAFDAFRRVYNEERPHEALGQRPPVSRYVVCLREEAAMKQADFENTEKVVTEFVKADLDGYFKGAFVFDPIRVEPQVDYWGDGEEYLEVIIVFDGDQELLSPRWTVGLTSRLRDKLEDEGIEAFPVTRFMEKSDWKGYERAMKKAKGNVATA